MNTVWNKTLNTPRILKADTARQWGEAQYKTPLHADLARLLARDPGRANPAPGIASASTASVASGDPVAAAAAVASAVSATAASSDQQLTQQAKNLVGQTFFATLLKQMHDSPFKSELFNGGKGGEAFNGLYDQTLAHHMAQKVGKRMTEPLVARYRKMAAANAYAKQKSPNPSSTATPTTERTDVASHR